MGGSSKQTIGYKIYVGLHMVLCHGPIDKIIGIKVGEKQAWTGSSTGGKIYIAKDSLFGGEEREGGVSGEIDFEQGDDAQLPNDYLVAQLGEYTPAWRKVAALVLRQVYIGMNPYLKPWAIKASRIHVRRNGLPQWYDERAEIPLIAPFTQPQRFCFALDQSNSMNTVTASGKTRFAVMKENMVAVLERFKLVLAASGVPADIAMGSITGETFTSITRESVTSGGIDEIISWVNGLSLTAGTDFTEAMNFASAYFSTPKSYSSPPGATEEIVNSPYSNTFIIVTDGEPDPVENFSGALSAGSTMINRSAPHSGANAVNIHVVNIDLENITYSAQMDNTAEDGVPVIDGSSISALYDSIFATFSGSAPTMNPAHIIRECLTDPDWGMGEPESDIDDANFRAAADQLYLEGFGLCLHWTKQIPIEEFIYEVCRHINGTLDINPSTGLWEIYLIRETYNPNDLIELGPSNVAKVTNFDRPDFGELVNSVTVKYANGYTESSSAITVEDTALIQMQGATINTKLEFPGIADPEIAQRAAFSSLNSLSRPLATCTIEADRTAAVLRSGHPFKLSWPKYGLDNTIMRVSEISFGNASSTRVRIKCVEDAFGLPEEVLVKTGLPLWQNPVQAPQALQRQIVFEAPYFEMVQRLGEADANSLLDELPEVAFFGAAAARTNNTTLNAKLLTSNGSGFTNQDTFDFCASAVLNGDIDRLDTQLLVRDITDYSRITIGIWAQIGEELLYLSGRDDTSITVKRGVLDTQPAKHFDGDVIYFWDEYSGLDTTQYVDGETVSGKILPLTGSQELDPAFAAVLPLELKGRAFRPYPPANVQINAAYFPDSFTTALQLTWSHRDRRQQTAPELNGWTEGSIGPEAGTTYTFRLKDETGAVIEEVTGLTGTTYNHSLAGLVGGNPYTLELRTVRNGYESLYGFTHTMLYDVPPPVAVSEMDPVVFFKVAETGGVIFSEIDTVTFFKEKDGYRVTEIDTVVFHKSTT